MKILLNNIDLNEALFGKSNIGFVPTMGSLHDGHISLIKKSLKLSNKTIVSIFVNPKQFNNKKDYKRYPRNIKKDLRILKRLKVDFIYLPKIKDVYKFANKVKIKLKKQDKILCAKYRKGHFEGVINVMTRFTQIINPSKIFMGEKDFQQLLLVKRYIEKNYVIKDVIEKPSISKAPSNKAVIGRYILPKKIFSRLINQKPGKGGEIHITDAIQSLLQSNEKFIAHNFTGKYLDCGSMNGYIKSTLEIAKS